MTLSEYWECVATALKANPEWRQGQAAFNVLVEHRIDLCDLMHDYWRVIDPFYNDDNLPAFEKWLEENWDQA